MIKSIINWVLSALKPIPQLELEKLPTWKNKPKFTVLLVEDDITQRAIMQEIISLSGNFNVLTAADTAEASSKVEIADLMIMDWRSSKRGPDKTQDTMIEIWERYHSKHNPFCVVSANFDDGEMDKLHLAGAWNIFDKPLNPQVLLNTLYRYEVVIWEHIKAQNLESQIETLLTYNRSISMDVQRTKQVVMTLVIIMLIAGGTQVSVPDIVKLLLSFV